MFAQYDIVTGAIVATNSTRVDDALLEAIGRAQIEVDADVAGHTHAIDTTGPVPVVVPIVGGVE